MPLEFSHASESRKPDALDMLPNQSARRARSRNRSTVAGASVSRDRGERLLPKIQVLLEDREFVLSNSMLWWARVVPTCDPTMREV